MSKSTETPVERTFFCIWPNHKMHIGTPEFKMTAMGERGFYSRSQRVEFKNQRFTTSDPALIAGLEEECRRQPQVISTKWLMNPVLSRKDDIRSAGPDDDVTPFMPSVLRGPAVANS